MPYSVTYTAEDHLICITGSGVLDVTLVRTCLSEAIRLAREHDCLGMLCNFREAAIAMSTLEMFDLATSMPRLISDAGLPEPKLRRAIVVVREFPDMAFYGGVSYGWSHNVRLFRDIGEARKWLLSAGQRRPTVGPARTKSLVMRSRARKTTKDPLVSPLEPFLGSPPI